MTCYPAAQIPIRSARRACAPYTRSLSDRAVIDPSGPRYERGHLRGFVREDGGGGNRTRVHAHWRGYHEGSEPDSKLVTGLVRGLCDEALDHTNGALSGNGEARTAPAVPESGGVA